MAEKNEQMKTYQIKNTVYSFISELKFLTENINSHYNHLISKQNNFNEKSATSKINLLNKTLDANIKNKFETCLSLINSTLYSLDNATEKQNDFINSNEELNKIKSINFIDIISTIDSKISLAEDEVNEIKSDSEYLLKISEKDLNKLNSIKNEIYNDIKNYTEFLSQIYNTTNNTILLNSKVFNNYYVRKFENDTSIIIKNLHNSVSNITQQHENQLHNFILDQDKVIKSANLLSDNVNDGLKNLAHLNERIQKIELEIINTINSKTELINLELKRNKEQFENQINALRNRTNVKTEKIKHSHKDFLRLVQNAGIYELTQNYDEKAKEEKQQYQTYRTYTGRAIGAAIFFTIAILLVPLVEHWGVNPPIDTNYYTILARLTISLMFFVLALYFSKQASKHYECYQENHRTFLQLAALEPFMARMTDEEQKEIRKGLIPSYFNQNAEGKFANKGDEVDMSMMFTFMDKLANLRSDKNDQKPDNTSTETKP